MADSKLHVNNSVSVDPEKRRESRSSITINLPLSVLGHGERGKTLRTKLYLIEKFKLAECGKLGALLTARSKGKPLSQEDRKTLEKLWHDCELDDLDLAELLVCNLPKICKGKNITAVKRFDPMPIFNERHCGEKYEEFLRHNIHTSSTEVKRFALPRVRAKLAVQEVICLLTSEPEKFASLIRKSPRYLACPATVDLLAKYREGLQATNPEVRQKAEKAITEISKSLSGKPKRKPRKYGYWRIDYYFGEILGCIKTANQIQNRDDRWQYLKTVNSVWGLPHDYQEILSNHVKNPAEMTLEIMVAKGMISDPSTYRNVIKPHIKKLTKRYPALRLADYLVEHVLDLPTRDPDQFFRLDLWKQLESFVFDLNPKELERGHAISQSITIIRV